jgi:segregation and condensation protein A
MLLPRHADVEEEDDPRAELIRRLQEYERYKQAAEDIDSLPRLHRDVFTTSAQVPDLPVRTLQPDVDMRELLLAFKDVLKRAEMYTHHHIKLEPLSVRERMSDILSKLSTAKFIEFPALFTVEEGRRGVVVTFLAILELIREKLMEIIQTEPYGPIHVKAPEACH